MHEGKNGEGDALASGEGEVHISWGKCSLPLSSTKSRLPRVHKKSKLY